MLKSLGNIGQIVKPGDQVGVNPNIVRDRNPEQAATTHPLVVEVLIARARKPSTSIAATSCR